MARGPVSGGLRILNWCQERSFHYLDEMLFGKEVRKVFPSTIRQRQGSGHPRPYYYSGLTDIDARAAIRTDPGAGAADAAAQAKVERPTMRSVNGEPPEGECQPVGVRGLESRTTASLGESCGKCGLTPDRAEAAVLLRPLSDARPRGAASAARLVDLFTTVNIAVRVTGRTVWAKGAPQVGGQHNSHRSRGR